MIERRAVSVSLGSSQRNKKVTVRFKDTLVHLERIGTDGDVAAAQRLFRQLDGKVDALGVGGVDLYIRVGQREYPLRAAHRLVQGVRRTPVVDGRGLKHTLERQVFQRAAPQLREPLPRFRRAFMPLALDRLGLAQAVDQVAEEVIFGDLMVGLGLPIPLRGLRTYLRVLRLLMPVVSYFPMRLLFYGSGGEAPAPKFERYWAQAELLAGDFMFMKKHLPPPLLLGKVIVSNTTTEANVAFLQRHGARLLITTTPRYQGRSFGTNMMEAALTAYAGKGRPLTLAELQHLIEELDLRPTVTYLEGGAVVGEA